MTRGQEPGLDVPPDADARGMLGIPVPSTARGLVLHELTWLALAIQAAWILASPDLWPPRIGVPVVAGAVTLSVATWVLLLFTQLRPVPRLRRAARLADVAALVGAALVASLAADSGATWDSASSLAILAAAVAGAMLDPRAGGVVVGGMAALAIKPSLQFVAVTGPWGVPTPFVPVYILVVGGCIIGVRLVLARNADAIDSDVARREEIERQRRLVEGVESALRRQERLLHETVLNTLTAIDRGGLGQSAGTAAALDARCTEAISVLTDLESGAQALDPAVTVSPTGYVSIGDDLASFIADLRRGGLDIEVVIDSLEQVPDRVRGAMSTAIREALANVARHAQAQHAWVLVRVHRGDGVTVRAEVRDDGRGFDTRLASGRFGLTRAIAGPMEEVGGQSSVVSRPGAGTKVLLEWTERSPEARGRAPMGRIGFALPAPATAGVFLAATAALAWLQFDHPVVTPTDLALVSVLGLLIVLATPEAPLSWGLIVTVGALGPLFAFLQAGAPGGSLGGGWALAAIAALYMTAAAIGPPWSWTVLLASWVVIDGSPLAGLGEPATLLIVGGALFGRSLRRDTEAMERARGRRVTAESALEVTRESLSRLRARYGALEDSDAIALLSGIVDGSCDPQDPDVRRQAGLEETFIRNLVRIDPQADEVRALAASLSQVAHRRGVHLRADVSLPPVPSVVIPATVAESLAVAVASTVSDQVAWFTARAEGDTIVVTLLAPIADGEQDHMGALRLPGIDTDPDDPSDTTMLWEARIAVGQAA